MKLLRVTQTKINELKQRVITAWNGRNDTRTAKQLAPFGSDSNPFEGVPVVYLRTELDGKEVIVGCINKNLLAEVGENRLFSTDQSGTTKMNLWLTNDGNMLLGTAENKAAYVKHLARFEELEIGFNQFKAEFNAFVLTYNAHTHMYLAPLVPAPTPNPVPTAVPVPTGALSTATITQAKIQNLKTT